MKFGILEIVGLFVIVAGCGLMVGAAALVSTALAVLVSGFFLLLFGVVCVYVAVSLDQKARAPEVRT